MATEKVIEYVSLMRYETAEDARRAFWDDLPPAMTQDVIKTQEGLYAIVWTCPSL